jgi:hypothetical protein
MYPTSDFASSQLFIYCIRFLNTVTLVLSPSSALMPKKPQVFHLGVANVKSPRARLDSQQGYVHRVLATDNYLMSNKLWRRCLDRICRAQRISACYT